MISLEDAIKRYNIPVPRYTSYPPANLFSDRYNSEDLRRDIIESNQRGERDLSFYIHIPFCRQICHFCACNKILLPKDEASIEQYINYLLKEFDLIAPLIESDRKIVQIHFGGGSPTSTPSNYISAIVERLTSKFDLKSDGHEIAIEIHPGYVGREEWERLIELPFTRYSIGIQDFSEEILKGVHRQPSLVPIGEVVEQIHAAGKRVNLDFIYGLPGQSAVSFSKSIERAVGIRPDRIVTFSYAHVPWIHKQQKTLERRGLPSVEEKEQMYNAASQLLTDAGYRQIGLDHFVLPDDPLAVAQSEHQLHRNFQGYCPLELSGQVYALGITGISQLFDSYAQNLKSLAPYYEALDADELPTFIGYKLTPEECMARDIITDLMCNYRTAPLHHVRRYGLELSSLSQLPFLDYKALEVMAEDGLLTITDEEEIVMNPEAHLFVRNVAAAFDQYYNPESPKGYSKPI
ncbi:MAG: oxygen-independent coproporphyrinogen III oxidase [Porphyromonas sp.]|nr:oxygen-independent coproporphyrinogen III oxidase [Porphyromonas sp.]